VLLTKADLCDDVDAALASARDVAMGVDVLALSVAEDRGIDALAAVLPPARTAVLIGSSGVGKSTLVNRLAGAPLLATNGVRDDGRGRHTTTHRQLVRLAGGALLIDTPGMRELQLWSADDGLEATFAEITELAASCHFRDCAHRAEPGCAVLAAVASGALSPERLDSWHRLARELAWLERKQDERLAAEENARVRALVKAGERRIREKWGRT
jgi:ribosome biogenesis GTPase